MKKNYLKNSSFVIFFIIALFYAINNIIWWKINTPVIPTNISAVHFYNIFENAFLYYNAPLITWIMKALFFVFGKESFDLQIIIVNYLFFLLGLYFIYKIGAELKDRKTGNIAMILFALTPAIYGMSRQYGHQDYHVTIAMIVNIYCLIKSNDFKDRKWSILYGITVGLGLLIKDGFLPYFFTPWLYVVIRSLIEKVEPRKIINILITIAVGSLISGCHYFNSLIMNKILNEPWTESVSVFAFENLRITTTGLWEYLVSIPIFLLFLIGLVYSFIRYKNKNKWILIIWIIIPWFIITFMPHKKSPEYCLPFIPAMILFASFSISSIKKYLVKTIFFMFFILICLFQFVTVSYVWCDNIYDKFSFTYKQNNIMFFNNKSYLAFYDKSNNEFNIDLLNHLKAYSKYSFIIPTVSSMDILPFMLINDINIKTTWFYDEKNILERDIFIFIGKKLDIVKLTDNIVSMMYARDNKSKEEFYKEIENKLVENFQKIKDNYYLTESFYIQNIADEDHFVRLYKKKSDNL